MTDLYMGYSHTFKTSIGATRMMQMFIPSDSENLIIMADSEDSEAEFSATIDQFNTEVKDSKKTTKKSDGDHNLIRFSAKEIKKYCNYTYYSRTGEDDDDEEGGPENGNTPYSTQMSKLKLVQLEESDTPILRCYLYAKLSPFEEESAFIVKANVKPTFSIQLGQYMTLPAPFEKPVTAYSNFPAEVSDDVLVNVYSPYYKLKLKVTLNYRKDGKTIVLNKFVATDDVNSMVVVPKSQINMKELVHM